MNNTDTPIHPAIEKRYQHSVISSIDSYGAIIIIFNGKHGDDYYLARNRSECDEVLLSVLKDRQSEGYWYGDIKDINKSLEELSVPSMTVEEAIAKDPRLGKIVEGEWKVYNTHKAEIENEKAELENILLALNTSNGALAYNILNSRGSYEYEGMEIEIPNNLRNKND